MMDQVVSGHLGYRFVLRVQKLMKAVDDLNEAFDAEKDLTELIDNMREAHEDLAKEVLGFRWYEWTQK